MTVARATLILGTKTLVYSCRTLRAQALGIVYTGSATTTETFSHTIACVGVAARCIRIIERIRVLVIRLVVRNVRALPELTGDTTTLAFVGAERIAAVAVNAHIVLAVCIRRTRLLGAEFGGAILTTTSVPRWLVEARNAHRVGIAKAAGACGAQVSVPRFQRAIVAGVRCALGIRGFVVTLGHLRRHTIHARIQITVFRRVSRHIRVISVCRLRSIAACRLPTISVDFFSQGHIFIIRDDLRRTTLTNALLAIARHQRIHHHSIWFQRALAFPGVASPVDALLVARARIIIGAFARRHLRLARQCARAIDTDAFVFTTKTYLVLGGGYGLMHRRATAAPVERARIAVVLALAVATPHIVVEGSATEERDYEGSC